jgi:hypothetical protein
MARVDTIDARGLGQVISFPTVTHRSELTRSGKRSRFVPMRERWHHFIHASLQGAADDPYVRLLRERLRSGSSVVRVHFESSGSGRTPEYRVVLALHRQLSEMRVPHSDSFTRWSLEAGVRMASSEEEVARFTLRVKEQFQPMEGEHGRDLFNVVLVEGLRKLGPPRVQARLANLHVPGTVEGRAKLRALSDLDNVLSRLAKELGASLKYDEAQVADILDAALEHYVSARFLLVTGEPRLPR